MPKIDGMTLYHKIKEIDDKVIICFTTADINYIEDLRKDIIDIDKIVLYKPVLLKDLKNKIDLLLSQQEVTGKPAMMVLWPKFIIDVIYFTKSDTKKILVMDWEWNILYLNTEFTKIKKKISQ